MRSDNLLIPIVFLYFAKHFLQAQTKICSLRQPDRQTLTYPVREHKELHLLTDLTMVALLGLLEHHQILIKHLLLGEGDTINTGELLTLGITTPESTGYACYLDGFDKTCGYEVRTTAEIGESTLCVSGDRTILQILIDMLTLILLTIGLELFQSIGLGDILANHRLVLFCQLLHLRLNLREVIL